MSNSLQEQLLKAGLADESQARKAQQAKRKQKKQNKGKRPAVDENRLQAQRAQAAKAERDRKLNQARQAEAEKKAVAAQIKQMIEAARLPKGDGDVAFNYVDNGKVKRLYVTKSVQKQLINGQAAIVKLYGQYNIVPAETAGKIAERDAGCIILHERGGKETPAEDDPYAEFQVPDDLMW